MRKMMAEFREIWTFRELLYTLVERDIRIRYKNSIFGFFWSFLNPLATTLVMTVVFGKLLHNDVPNFSAYVLAAYLPFSFFQQSVLDSSQSILGSMQLVKKIYFPRELLPFALVISNFIHLVLGFGVFFLLLLAIYIVHPGDIPFRATTIYLPILLVISLILASGMSLLVSALNTFYEDVKYIVGVALYLLFFLCPVMYFIETIANSDVVRDHPLWFKIYNLNPVADLSVAYRKVLLAPTKIMVHGLNSQTLVPANPIPIEWNWIGYSALFSIVTFIVGYTVFSRLKWRFVERT
jgi:lipopolysaccharide transport system permease protein